MHALKLNQNIPSEYTISDWNKKTHYFKDKMALTFSLKEEMFFQQFRVLYDISRKIVVKSTLAEDVDIYTYGHFSGYNIVVSCACAATHKNQHELRLRTKTKNLIQRELL